MLEGSAGGFAVIFEDEHVAEALVVFQVEHAVAVGPQNILDGARRERGEGGHVVGRFDNDFVSADAVHLIEEAFAFAVEIAFNDERGEAIGNDANVPAGSIGAATIAAVNENFGRRFAFGAGAEGAILRAGDEDAFAEEIGGALSAIGGDDDPTARDGIFTQLRQSEPPRNSKSHEANALRTVLCLRLYRVWRRLLQLGAEGVFVETDGGGVAGVVVDGEDVEAAGTIRNVAVGEEALCGAGDDALFVGGDAEFGESGEIVAQSASADFDEGEGFAVVADEVEFAFYTARCVVAGNEDVAVAAEIPVGIGFATDAGAAGGEFALVGGGVGVVAQTFAGGPMDELEDGAGEEGHGGRQEYKESGIRNTN